MAPKVLLSEGSPYLDDPSNYPVSRYLDGDGTDDSGDDGVDDSSDDSSDDNSDDSSDNSSDDEM
jgi:hypothetical protein